MDDNNYNPTYNEFRPRNSRLNFKNLLSRKPNFHRPNFKFGKISKKTLVIGCAVFLVVVGLATLFKYSLDNSANSNVLGDQKVQIADAKASQNINKEYAFPIKNDKGDEISRIKYSIQNVEKRDQIVAKGQKADAVVGRTFLIVNLKIVNDYNQAVQINTRDYIRLTVSNNDSEKLAPDIHNDPVEVQAISTKFTRVGFFVNDSDKNLKLFIGEIKGDKSVINLNI